MAYNMGDIKMHFLPSDVLERWEVPPINEVSRKLEKINSAVQKQEGVIEELRYAFEPCTELRCCAHNVSLAIRHWTEGITYSSPTGNSAMHIN